MTTRKNSHLGRRIFAFFIDYLVVYCFFYVYTWSLGVQNDQGGYTVTGINAFVPLIFWFIYMIVIESSLNATLGHFVFGLKVVKNNFREKIGFIDSLKRHLTDFIEIPFFGIPAIICISNTDLNQRLGDLWANTMVVSDKEENEA